MLDEPEHAATVKNTFEPQLLKKLHQILRWTAKFCPSYAKGMTTRAQIVATFKEMYDADVSPSLISKSPTP